MSESIVLQLPLSEEYDALFAQAREQTNLRKCRCWFDRTAAVGDIRVKVTDRDIGIRYETKKGFIEDRCVYSAVSALTELKTGIVVRLSHGRMLFLPAGGSREYMLALIRATERMERHIAYRFRDGAMALPGVGILDRIRFRLRPNRGIIFPLSGFDFHTKWSIVALMCFSLFLGTMFVSAPIRNQQITPEQAESVTAVYDGAGRHYRRAVTKSVTLHFQDHPDLTVRYRPAVLWDALEQVEPGTTLELLVHPGDAGVLEVVADGEVLLDFEGTMKVVRTDAVLFPGLGVFLYVCAGYIGYEVFFKEKRKKTARSK